MGDWWGEPAGGTGGAFVILNIKAELVEGTGWGNRWYFSNNEYKGGTGWGNRLGEPVVLF